MKRRKKFEHTNSKRRKVTNRENRKRGPWWDGRSTVIGNHLSQPSGRCVGDTPLSWSSRLEFEGQCSGDFSFSTSRKIVPKKQRIHTTGLSKKKLAVDEILISRKIRVDPTPHQKRLFHDYWVNTTRFVYNKTLEYTEATKYHGDKKVFKPCVFDPDDKAHGDEYPWLFYNNRKWLKKNGKDAVPDNAIMCPKDAKAAALFSFFDAKAADKEQLEGKRERGLVAPKTPVMKPRSREDATQHIYIDVNGGKLSVAWTLGGFKFWPATGFGILKPLRTGRDGREMKRLTEKNGGSNECRFRAVLEYERPDRYFMIIPVMIKKQEPSEEAREMIAFDPGVRTFLTGYDNHGSVIEYGKDEPQFGHVGISKIFLLGKKLTNCNRFMTR